MLLHTRMHTPSTSPTLHSTPITSCHVSVNSNTALQSFNTSRGSLPPADSESCEIEMFAPLMRVVTPMSVNQFVSSSGLPTTMHFDADIAKAGLSKEQTEEIFHLTHKAQKLGKKIKHDFINLFQSGGTVLHGCSGYRL